MERPGSGTAPLARNRLALADRPGGLVYYTYTSNPAFTPVLYDKGISNCVLYPDDFRWLKPDLTLLDCRHAAHASLYRQLAIDYIFIAMQLPDQKNIQDKDISILYLPPTPYLSSGSGPRLETLTKRLQDIKKDKERNIIVGLLGKGNKNSKILEDFYRVINLKSASNLNGNLNCSKELEHYAS